MLHSRISLIVVPMLLLGSLGVLFYATDGAEATTYYYGTTHASANNGTHWRTYERYTSASEDIDEARISNDNETKDLYTSAIYSYVMTNDFTCSTYCFDPDDLYIGGHPVSIMPPDNGTATIDYVWVSVRFVGTVMPCYLSFSPDNQSTWYTSSYITGMYDSYYWQVTSKITWNATILNSNELWVKMKGYPVYGTHYYIDYLGISVRWHTDYVLETYGIPMEEEPEEPDPIEDDSGANYTWDIIMQDGGLVGVLGALGFIGMIGTPALAVWVVRNTNEGRMVTFVKMTALFFVFLTLFMLSVTGG